MAFEEGDKMAVWYVMRDLKRSNAKLPAYKVLEDEKMTVYTPMEKRMVVRQGQKSLEEIPFMPDLLFVCDTRENLDPVVAKIPTLQYRWLYNTYRVPMTVSDPEMRRFIHAVNTSKNPRFYLPEEVTPQMCGQKIRIIGGPLDGYEGRLLTIRGSRVKRLLVELKGFFSVGVEVSPEYIQQVGSRPDIEQC